MLSFSYTGENVLQGPHQFAVNCSIDSFSAVTTASVMRVCSGGSDDAALLQQLPDAVALAAFVMCLSELSSTTLLVAARTKGAEQC